MTNYPMKVLVEKLKWMDNYQGFFYLEKLYQRRLIATHYHYLFLRFRVKKELEGKFLIHQNFWDIIFDNLTHQN